METPDAVTIDSVLALPGLGLRLVAGAGGRGNPIRWVHVSEAEDPTPWLRGGELLLTTGMAITDPERFGPYVRRLAAAGLAGLGFGVDFAHERAPAPLRAAADATGLPVIEIAVDTPFMAISEAVSSGLSAERHAELGRVLRAQRTLTRAMLDHGDTALVAELARALDCWAARTGQDGTPRYATPPEAVGRVAPIVPDLRRVRGRRQPSAVSTVTPDAHVMAHPIGAPGRIRGFVVIGRPHAFTPYDRMVLSVAVSLLAVEAEQEHRARAGVLRRAFAGEPASSVLAEHAAGWGLDPDAVRVSVLDAPDGRAPELAAAVDRVLSSGHPGAAYLDGTRVRALTGPDAADALAAAVSGIDGARLALGDVVPAGRALESLRHAELAAGAGGSARVTDFADLDAFALLLGHVPAEALDGFADRLLGVLERHDAAYGTDLLRTLRAFLDADGQWNRAAADLGVHRHTLRARVDRIAGLTGQELGSGYARAGLWLALRARALGGR